MTVVLDAMQSMAERAGWAGAVAEHVPAPCVSVCRLDPQRTYCEGCLRSIDEIRVWRTSTDQEKKAIWALIAQRAAVLSPAVP